MGIGGQLFHVFQDPGFLGCRFSGFRFFMVQVFQGPSFSGSRLFWVQVFQGQGFSGSRFFMVQVFQGPGFSGSRFFRVRVQGPGAVFRSNRRLKVFFNLDVLKNFIKITGKQLRRSLFLIKLQAYSKFFTANYFSNLLELSVVFGSVKKI